MNERCTRSGEKSEDLWGGMAMHSKYIFPVETLGSDTADPDLVKEGLVRYATKMYKAKELSEHEYNVVLRLIDKFFETEYGLSVSK